MPGEWKLWPVKPERKLICSRRIIMGVGYFIGTLCALHVITIVMVPFLPEFPGCYGSDRIGFFGLMLILGSFVYYIIVLIMGGTSLLLSVIYLICYTLVYIFILICLWIAQ
jgi:hypothetical protein